jgi:phosphatidylinositol alpha-1,6-mannosyltransferase
MTPRILLATQDFPPVEGGMARYYADLARGFPAGSFLVSTTREEGTAAAAPDDVPVRREPFPLSRAHRLTSLLRWQRDLDLWMKVEKPDVLLCGNLRPLGPVCVRLARKSGVPCHVIVHGNDLLAARRRWSGLRSSNWNTVFGGVERWIANSEAIRRIGVDRLGLPEARSAVVHPEVDTDHIRPATEGEKAALRSSLGIASDECVIVFVGRLVTRKGLDRLIEALANDPPARPWRLVVVGYGDPSAYREMAEKGGIAQRVMFRGGVSDAELLRILRMADVAAMPSRTIPDRDDIEGFGIVYLEAAAAGIPVVAGDSGGVVEAVEDGVTGFVIRGDDSLAIRSALDRLLGNPGLAESMGRAARDRAVARYGPGSSAKRLRKILEEEQKA